ncbi:MAG: TIGR02710 family CRISPR-associated protein [Magnetococcales bacterium]|nr:TIGR02710 family CRISPR-associated protein [Magnetococcales bacterium]MBF0321531.1 TIGR02710 family CRISPR-associated protein [Magnetococcales bacterium]
MNKPNKSGQVLLLTVGTGDGEQREATLYRPLRLSIEKGTFSEVILLPSLVSEEWAEQVRTDLASLNMHIHPLPRKKDEENADHCFNHFDRVLTELLEAGWQGHQIAIDPTRGTKMMSAALILAAVRRDVTSLRYITGERDTRGMVQSGTEQIAEFRTTRITAARRLDDALHLFQHGNFAVVLDVVPDPDLGWATLHWPEVYHPGMRAIRSLAQFYTAWDRLNYQEAHKVALNENDLPDGRWKALAPTLAVREWLKRIAGPFPEPDDESTRKQSKAPYLLRLAVDLWGNGQRRIKSGQLEDAAVRAYRILEMIGQMRLFERGHDSAQLDPRHPEIAKYVTKMAKNKDTPLSKNRDGTLMAPRERVTGLLRSMGDEMGKTLIDLGNDSLMSANVRNTSILIHGFCAKAPDGRVMAEFYRKLEEELLRPCLGEQRLNWLEWVKMSFDRS